MPKLARLCVALLAVAALPAAAPQAAESSGGAVPRAKTLYSDGPSGRYLVDGSWLRRLDPNNVGLAQGWQKQGGGAEWTPTKVPNAWNAGDDSLTSYLGSVGWYRNDLRLPAGAPDRSWVIRFEQVNYSATVWLNGVQIGSHSGAHEPFELRLPKAIVKTGAANSLVLRIDSRRTVNDLPPSRNNEFGEPQGGWWNYAGILREVYLRAVDQIDITSVNVRPDLPCPSCAAVVNWQVKLSNLGTRTQSVTVAGRFGPQRLTIGKARLRPGASTTLTKKLTVAKPKLWSPARPYLYDASLVAAVGARTLQRYTRHVGVRLIGVDSVGRLTLNGQRLDLRGVGMHEDAPGRGFAIDNAFRDKQIGYARDLGGLMLRSHYPLHPYTLQRADQLGMLVWSEVPVYQIPNPQLAVAANRARYVAAVASMVEVNRDHASIAVWSIGNEMATSADASQASYIAAATAKAKALDPGRPVGIAAGGPTSACQSAYDPLDLIGLNDYFGWYVGESGSIADRDLLSDALDAARKCYPTKAMMITEYGAEASTAGQPEDRGTWAFANELIKFHLDVYATKPWLSGSLYWALQEFWVRPGWDGGNPFPAPPLHQKGLVSFAGAKKPIFAPVQKAFKAVKQVGSTR
jgi:beta-glucuronidase